MPENTEPNVLHDLAAAADALGIRGLGADLRADAAPRPSDAELNAALLRVVVQDLKNLAERELEAPFAVALGIDRLLRMHEIAERLIEADDAVNACVDQIARERRESEQARLWNPAPRASHCDLHGHEWDADSHRCRYCNHHINGREV